MNDWGTCARCGAHDVDVWGGDTPDVFCAACCDDAVFGPDRPITEPLRRDRLIGAGLLLAERKGVIARADKVKESALDGGPRRVWRRLPADGTGPG